MKKLVSKIYTSVMDVRNMLYDYDFFDSIRLKKPVISVGNLSFGGTGKTPTVAFLLEEIEKRQKTAAVISRNYKAAISKAAQVDVHKAKAAYYFGDEPVWLAERHPKSHIFVGPKKWKTALFAEEHVNPDFYIIDDGFQHRSLARDLDIVLIDASQNQDSLQRENFSSLDRAHVVILTKTNQASVENLERLRQLTKEYVVYENSYLSLLDDDVTGPVLAICGLAQPEGFKSFLKKQESLKLLDFVSYPDHHAYTEKDITEIIEKFKTLGASFVLTTEKDEVKLRSLWPEEIPLRTVDVKLEWAQAPQKIYEFLDRS